MVPRMLFLARNALANTGGAIPAPAATPVPRALTARVKSAIPANWPRPDDLLRNVSGPCWWRVERRFRFAD